MAAFVSRGPRDTVRFAQKVLAQAKRRRVRPIILALSGELGSGKTTFVRGLAAALGIREKIQSPTFVLMRTYPIQKQFHHFHHFIHIDAYRLERPAEARRLGLADIFRDRDAVVVIEWAERIKKPIPQPAVWIYCKHGRKLRERIIEIKNKKSTFVPLSPRYHPGPEPRRMTGRGKSKNT